MPETTAVIARCVALVWKHRDLIAIANSIMLSDVISTRMYAALRGMFGPYLHMRSAYRKLLLNACLDQRYELSLRLA